VNRRIKGVKFDFFDENKTTSAIDVRRASSQAARTSESLVAAHLAQAHLEFPILFLSHENVEK
jgi:hypothetical protein